MVAVWSTAVAYSASSNMSLQNPRLTLLSLDNEVVCVLRQFLETESLGNESDTGNDCFLCNITFEQGHYQVGICWKRHVSELRDILILASIALKCCNRIC